MSTSLLKTKLYIPTARSELVSRPHLVERLKEGFRRGRKLTLISAPAGYGKTTLLGEWIACSEPRLRVAWVSLDKGDNDPARFWSYVVAAFQTVQADIGEIAQTAFQSPRPLAIEPVLTGLLNQIAEWPDPFVLVLDDYHVIKAPAIHEALSFLLEHMPPQMHLVLATRADPPLPIPRLRGRGQLSELYQSDLRFRSEEIAQFLDRVVGLTLSAEDIAALERRTEGWIAGLQMAAISMRGRDDISGFVRAFAGSHRYIIDYLGEEVLRQQGRDVQAFLLQTAILDRLSGALCDAVIGARGPSEEHPDADSQSVLEHLERNNLFIVSLDDRRQWYRYHPLFGHLLRQRLQRERRDQVPELHRRASRWYEQNGLISEAVSHALAAGDDEQAARLIEQGAWATLARCEMMTLLNWLDVLPRDLVRARPQLVILRAWALAIMGRWDDVEVCLSDAALASLPSQVAAVRAYVSGVRGDVPRTIELARQALEQLPEENPFLRSRVALSQGIAYLSKGRPVDAHRALTEAIALGRATGETYMILDAMMTLGHVQEMHGLLRQAVETHRQALRLAAEQGGGLAPVAGMAYVGIAEVLYEWNDLDGALRHALEGVRLTGLGGFTSYRIAGSIQAAKVHQARGNVDRALEVVRGAEKLAQKHNYAYMKGVSARLRVRLWVAQGDLEAACRWAREHRLGPAQELDLAREVEQIAVARALLASAPSQGRAGNGEIGEAIELLARLQRGAESAGRVKREIEVLALQALALWTQANLDRALPALERALSLAEPEGYVRTFVDEGEPMAQLLRSALSRGIAPNYVARLLAAFGQEVERASPGMESLVEPLSERETEVLRLVVAGLSNPEIAEELVVAVSTVKSHINSIYGKLGVERRTQAVARAQELGLL